MKLWWFTTIAKHLIKEHYFGQYLKCSYQWFDGLCRRFKIAFWWAIRTAQTAPKDWLQQYPNYMLDCYVSVEVVILNWKTLLVWTRLVFLLYSIEFPIFAHRFYNKIPTGTRFLGSPSTSSIPKESLMRWTSNGKVHK